MNLKYFSSNFRFPILKQATGNSSLLVPAIMLTVCLVFSNAAIAGAAYSIRVTSVDNRENPFGVGLQDFFFSWKLSSSRRNVTQKAYQIMVANDPNFSTKNLIWNSGKQMSDQSILIPYSGPKLSPGTKYHWKIRSWSNKGKSSGWSKTAEFTTGLFEAADWKGAQWIAYDKMPPENRLVPGIHLPGKDYRGKDLGFHKLPIFRKSFESNKKVKLALVFVSGLGHYKLFINGEKIGNSELAPGWTHYDEEALYNIYDCTAALKMGQNALAMMLGNGFLVVPNGRYRKVMTAYANPMLICRLHIQYEDGSEENIVSGESWKVTVGPITFSSIFGGEDFDARLEPEYWKTPGFDDSAWAKPVIVDPLSKSLLPERDYPVEIKQDISFKAIHRNLETPFSWTYDFGQNAAAIFRITVQGKPGDTIRLTPAELIVDSTFAVNQRGTGRTHEYYYILRGGGPETWQPHFTYYGFRYLQIDQAVPAGKENPDGLPVVQDLKMLHLRNAMPETGHFSSSHDLFNRINQLIQWAIKSNVVSVMTDCPHREKLGWLEQTYLMGGSIHYNYEVYTLYKKIIHDMRVAQTKEGLVPAIVPEFVRFGGDFTDSPEWGSAAVIVPWLVYKWYGDKKVLQDAFPMMEAYVAYLKSKSDEHLVSHGLGDWYDLGPERPGYAQLTPKSLTATAVYYYDVKLISDIAGILEDIPNRTKYAAWAQEIKDAFNREFFDPKTNLYATGSQTSIAMPLVMGLVEADKREAVVQTLVSSIQQSKYALTAGDIGFHFLVKALEEAGRGDIIYKMNARDDVPGYGYQLKKGATALTESWQALEVVSNNHLMLGHLMEWFYSGLGGIDQTESSVAYRNITIRPQILEYLEEASVDFESPYGKIASAWKRENDRHVLEIEIPVNTSAIVILPAGPTTQIYENGKLMTRSNQKVAFSDSEATFEFGSGKYVFEIVED